MSVQRLARFDGLTCSPETSMAEVLARIDRAAPNLFQIVLNDTGAVLGTITDGDIRRAILQGAALTDTVSRCMRSMPLLGRLGEDRTNRLLLRRAWFVPVVDQTGRLDHIILERRTTGPTQALVMAGGFGRRLGELTKQIPKPLLPVAGRPILDRVLEQIEAAGVSTIFVAVHYLSDQIEAFLRARASQAQIKIVHEDAPLGTAGALTLIAGEVNGPILVANGDVLTGADLTALHEFHAGHNFDGTIAVSRHETEIPFGVIRQTSDGHFAGIEEKPRVLHFVAAGIYYLSPEFISLVSRERPVDMPEVISAGAAAGLRIGLFPVHEYWKDVGRPGDLAAAQVDHKTPR